jgi:hypothetical protein
LRRVLRAAALLGGVLIAALAAAALVEIDSPRLGRALLDRAGAATGATLSAERFRMKLSRGVILRGVRASAPLPSGRVEAEIEELVFEARWLPLLFGRAEVTRLRLLRPHVRLADARGRPAPSPGTSTPAGALLVRRLTIEDGRLEMPARGISVQDVDVALRLEDGVLRTESLAFSTPEGRFTGALEARPFADPLAYTLRLEGRPLDLNAAAPPGGGRLGPATLKVEARGVGAEPRGLRATGTLALGAGTLPAAPLLVKLEQALGRTPVVGAGYEPAVARYRVEDGRVFLEALALRSGRLEVNVSGWSDLDGRVDLAAVVRAPRDGVQLAGVSAAVLDALTDPEGRVSIPVRVTGVRPQLVVRPDAGAMLATAGRAAGSKAREAALSLGERLLGRRRR